MHGAGEPRSTPSVLTLLVPGDSPGSIREIPLRYARHETDVYVVAPAEPLPAWAVTLQSAQAARWRIGDTRFAGRVLPVARDRETIAAIRMDFERQHGRRRVRSWFGSNVVAFRLQAEEEQTMAASEVVEDHFDRQARDYDERVQVNPMDAALRRESVRSLLQTFGPGDHVLEIGCGTGLETLALAHAGIHVVALDVSQGMLDRLADKARAAGLGARIRPRKLAAADLPTLVPEFGGASFDGAFSDFGALNLEPDLGAVPAGLASLVRPGGRVVFGIWNRVCLAELSLYAVGLRPSRALSRLSWPVPVGRSRFGLPAYPRSPGPFMDAFRPAFAPERVEALPFLVPPYDFLPHVPRSDRVLPLLEAADAVLRRRFPFNRLGDHFVATLRRTQLPLRPA